MNNVKIIIQFIIIVFALSLILNKESKATGDPYLTVNQQYKISELNRMIFNELNKGKIVMLGDAYHGHGFFMYKVSKFLNYWLDQLEDKTNSDVPTKLVLFLEENNEVVNEINKFIETGDISTFLKFYIDYDSQVASNIFTIDYCIFVHQLRQIKQHINQKLNPDIDLKIIGAEPKAPYDINQLTKMPTEEYFRKKAHYFAYKRDLLITQNIQKFLNDNTDFKSIIFYGGAHLIREKVNKKQILNDPNIKEDMYGYFLAHYLDSLYTRNNVCVFYERPIFNFKYENIFKPPTDPGKPDYYISEKTYPNHSLTMSFARSKTYLQALHDVLSKYKDKKPDAEKMIYRNLALKFANAIMHTYLYENIENTQEIRKMAEEILSKAPELLDKYEIVQSLKRCDDGLAMNIMHNSYDNELVNMLSNIPAFQIDVRNNNSLENGHLSLSIKQKIKNLKEDISIYLAIHTLFIADQDESQQIIEYLDEKLGLGYNTKIDWFNWWQNKYLINCAFG